VGRHEGGVDVEDDLRRGRPDALKAIVVDGVDHPEGGRVRGDPAEEIDLIAKGAKIRQAVPAVGEHQRQVAHHPPGFVVRGASAGRRHRLGEAICQPEPIGQPGEQNAPGARGHGRVIREQL
jgi:hypothetical protein